MAVSQKEYNVSTQKNRNLYFKINLLNFDMLVVEELSGVVLSGTFTSDATSDIRNTLDVSLVVKDASFNVAVGGKIWIDKYIQFYVGIYDQHLKEIVWTNKGIYLINSPTLEYSATTKTLSFSGVDLMAKLTGIRNGVIEGEKTVIPANSDVKNVIIAALTQWAGFSKYIINSDDKKTAYKIELDTGSTIYDLLTEIQNMYPTYEFYFDENGVFIYQPIPTGQNENVVADDNIFGQLYTGYQLATNFEDVKNVVEVFGRTLNSGHQPHTTVKDTNPDSPFFVDKIGEIRIILSGDVYDNILTDELCQERAKYELWLRTRLQDSITINIIPLYWLKVNQLISFTLPNESEPRQWLIKNINEDYSVSGVQSIEAIQYYPLYPDI